MGPGWVVCFWTWEVVVLKVYAGFRSGGSVENWLFLQQDSRKWASALRNPSQTLNPKP